MDYRVYRGILGIDFNGCFELRREVAEIEPIIRLHDVLLPSVVGPNT
jgi:hypothetical protein